jgi:hypothetical protein
MYMTWIPTFNNNNLLYKSHCKVLSFYFFTHSLMMACRKPKRVHVAGSIPLRYKLCSVDVVVGFIVVINTETDLMWKILKILEKFLQSRIPKCPEFCLWGWKWASQRCCLLVSSITSHVAVVKIPKLFRCIINQQTPWSSLSWEANCS